MRSAEGSVQKVGRGKWRVVVELPRDPETGKRRQRVKRVRGSRRDAERARVELLVEASKGVAGSGSTVREYAERAFLPAKRAQLKPRTVDAYESRLRGHVYPALGDVALRDLTPAKVRTWLERMEAEPPTKKEALKVLSQVCKHAVYHDAMEYNPCDRVEPVKSARYEPVVLTAEQAIAYLAHFEGSAIEPAVLLAMGCGLRRGEIAALEVEDIDWGTGAVTVDKSTVTTAHDGTVTSTTKNGRSRVVHMPPPLLERLREVAPKSGPIMATRKGDAYRPASITQAYMRMIDKLPDGLPRVPLKNLRHTSLTLAYDSGARITDVRDRAGHSSEAVTERYYVRPKVSHDAEIARAVGDMLERAAGHTTGHNPTAPDGPE
jgi:integrase